MLELLYSSGLRLCRTDRSRSCGDVDLNDATVRVTGKGNKDRIVPGWAGMRATRHSNDGIASVPNSQLAE